MNFKDKLRGNYDYFVKNIDLPSLVDHLYQEFLVNDEEKHKLDRMTKFDGQIPAARQLLKFIVKKKNKNLEKKFYEALKNSGNEHIHEQLLKECDLKEIPAEDPFEDRDEELKKMSLNIELLVKYVADLKKDKRHEMDAPEIVRQFTSEDTLDSSQTQTAQTPYSVQSKHGIEFRSFGINIAHFVVNDLKDQENCCPVAKTLRRLVKDVINTHSKEFEELVIKLKLWEKKGFDWIMKIIDETFLDEPKDNCRLRLVVIFAFSGWIAKKCKEFG